MDKEKFFEELKIALNRDENISEEMVLSDLPEMDSLGAVCIVSMMSDCFNCQMDLDDLQKVETVKDLMNLAFRKE